MRNGLALVRSVLVLMVAVVLLSLMSIDVPQAGADVVATWDLTFEGPSESGGTIRLTFSADRSEIIRGELRGFRIPSIPGFCPGTSASTVWYFDLDHGVPIVGGQFDMRLPITLGISGSTVAIHGAFTSENTLEGTAAYYYLGCPQGTANVSWSAAGPIGTPPKSGDLLFVDSAADGGGSITLTTDPLRTLLTSLVLNAVSFPPCTDPDNPLDVRVFFDPPIDLPDGGPSLWINLETPGDTVFLGLAAAFVDEDVLEGTLAFYGLFHNCETDVNWRALRRPAVVGGISMDLDGDQAGLPLETAGSSGDSAGLLAGVIAAVVAAAFALTGAAWWARRRLKH